MINFALGGEKGVLPSVDGPWIAAAAKCAHDGMQIVVFMPCFSPQCK